MSKSDINLKHLVQRQSFSPAFFVETIQILESIRYLSYSIIHTKVTPFSGLVEV